MIYHLTGLSELAAQNKLGNSQSVSQSVLKKFIVYCIRRCAPPLGRRGLRPRLPKNGVAAPAAPTILNGLGYA
jgi:hypothetical protein